MNWPRGQRSCSGTGGPGLCCAPSGLRTIQNPFERPAIPATLKIVGLVVFASTIFTRAVDPLIPKIAADLAIDVKTAALLSTAFTFPYALVQPVLGALGDHFGKTRLMNLCLLVVALASLVCAVAMSLSLLIAMRVLAGCVAGGLFPIALALIGDLVPVQQRQVAIGRLLAVGLSGNLLGASIAGVIADLAGWRGVFGAFGLFALVVTIAAYAALRGRDQAKPAPFRLASAVAGFRSVFADPRAKVCFGAVFLEGLFIHGVFPYVALLLLANGEARASIAGLVIAAFGLGGVVYSMLVSTLVARFAQPRLMIIGGLVAAGSLVLIALNLPWYEQIGVYGLLGFGFYLLHGSIHVHVTELSPTARGAATSLHSSTFYLGQALGPIYYGFTFSHDEVGLSLVAGALVVVAVGLVCARLLRHPVEGH
jgi:predicted MFS family arabinose efflux permease